MVNCVDCGVIININSSCEIFYTVKVGVYRCQKCHNKEFATYNDLVELEQNSLITKMEIFVILFTVFVFFVILYFLY